MLLHPSLCVPLFNAAPSAVPAASALPQRRRDLLQRHEAGASTSTLTLALSLLTTHDDASVCMQTTTPVSEQNGASRAEAAAAHLGAESPHF